jgi:hypothetical protein
MKRVTRVDILQWIQEDRGNILGFVFLCVCDCAAAIATNRDL